MPHHYHEDDPFVGPVFYERKGSRGCVSSVDS